MSDPHASTDMPPASLGYRMPAEWDAHAATWLVSLAGNATPANPTAQTIDRVGSVGDLLRDLR